MGKTLVLAEKPSVAREIARVLGCRKNGAGCIIGDKYIVTWALGHLVTLADPDHYGDQYKTWSLETLPMIPKKMDLIVIKETSKQYACVKNLLHLPEVSDLVIATDAGREGELVARWIIDKAGFKKPIKRLWISSQTDKAIKDGFANLKDAREYVNLYYAAKSRAEADWLVGLNTTRALTCKYNAQLSAGRVQTPTLAMIVVREEEIRKFIPKDYWTISAHFDNFFATWRDNKNNIRIFDKEKADKIVQNVAGKRFTVTEVDKTLKKEAPPLLYDLTELQRDANRKFGFSAKQTLNAMQRLYEQYKILTYPRTDSRYITGDIIATLTDRLKAANVGPYAPMASDIIKNRKAIERRCVDDKKVSDHHAIIPTEESPNLTTLPSDERKIYDLVVRRFLSAFMGSCEYEQMSVTIEANGEKFSSKGRRLITKGWKNAYDRISEDEDSDDEVKDQELPILKKGEMLVSKEIRTNNKKTTPPKRYTEATLLSAMEHPGKFIDDNAMREVMEKTSGLGTPATRAEIIERLFSAFYAERRGKEIHPTSKGIQLINIVPTDLREPELTAKWEQQLENISRGREDKDKFIENIKSYSDKLVKLVIGNEKKYTHDNATRTPCPNCGKFLLDVKGKKGKMLVCQDRECGYRQNMSIQSNYQCPTCHKKLELFGEGEKRKYICSCGFREGQDSFNKKMSENRNSSNKRDVAEYLNQQKKEQKPEVSAFELALQKAMEDRNKK